MIAIGIKESLRVNLFLVGIKLFIEYLHAEGYIHFEVNKWLSFGLIAVIFTVAYLIARRKGPIEDIGDTTAEEAEELFTE